MALTTRQALFQGQHVGVPCFFLSGALCAMVIIPFRDRETETQRG